jgi:PAS domain S-box-containing protein
LRRQGTATDAPPAESAAPTGRLGLGDAIALIHRAGGKAFLAHPLVLCDDPNRLDPIVERLANLGLDGLEAHYSAYPEDIRRRLCALAARHGLAVSAGSDLHSAPGEPQPGIEMPADDWRRFRNCVTGKEAADWASRRSQPGRHHPPRLRKRHFILRIMLPAMLALVLFVAAMFGVFLPAFERSLLDRKREMIRELTHSAWSILAGYERDVRDGLMSREQAQQTAARRIESLRYGREGNDYFWLQDLHPRMVMHPYRKDLNGQDVSGFRDPRGVHIFVEFANLVRRQGEGYIDYVWESKDDPRRLVPKESYIKWFEPWGWVIGTGIYIEDVNLEIARMERNLIRVSLGISGVVLLLLLYVVQQSLRIERQRSEAVESLHESTERYRSLVEAATEATLLVVEGRCRYANPTMLALLGRTEYELGLLDLTDILPPDECNKKVWRQLEDLASGVEPAGGVEGVLQRRDGSLIECVFVMSPFSFGGSSGFILLAKELSVRENRAGEGGALAEERLRRLGLMADRADTGLARARAARRGTILEANQAALDLLRGCRAPDAASPPALADLFHDAADWEQFLSEALAEGRAQRRRLQLPCPDARTRVIALTATLARDEQGQPVWLEASIRDITEHDRHDSEREQMVERLQSSLLFLHESVRHFTRGIVTCPPEKPVGEVAALMTAHHSSAALLQADSGAILGIVTDSDLRARVLAGGSEASMPVCRIMSAPLLSVPESAMIYEALLIMEEHGVQHLAVRDEAERISGVVRNKELLQFHRYGAIVLTREVERARTADDVIRICRRAPELIRALIASGARPRHVARIMSAVCDAATARFFDLAVQRLGPPPTDFVFLALGSQGRMEQTLLTDQDNAILYADLPESPTAHAAADYFRETGTLVCDWLHEAGFTHCQGHVMAKNPRWCQPMQVWKQYFDQWIHKAEPQELLEFSIVFDFRPVVGRAELAAELRQHVHKAARVSPAFFPHLAANTLLFKPPVRAIRRFLAAAAGADSATSVNLKDAMMPIVGFARLYSLRHEIAETNTFERLAAMVSKHSLTESSHDETLAAYEILLRLRLEHQAEALAAGQPLTNSVAVRRVSHMDRALLDQAFAQTAAIQKKISYDFLGGM